MPITNLSPEEVEELIQLIIARINADKNKPAAKPAHDEDDEPAKKGVFGRHSK